MQKLDFKTNIILHIGSSLQGKNEAMKRFTTNFNQLHKNVKELITIENDDKNFNIRNTLSLAKKL